MTHQSLPIRGGFFSWLRDCFNQGGLHGSDLVDHNIAYARGRFSTGPSDADDDLRKAEALGWIVRGKYSPTLSQRAFLGLAYRGSIPDIHASCWFWVPTEDKTKRTEVVEWLQRKFDRNTLSPI